MIDFSERLAEVRGRIAVAASGSGRSAKDVELVAVSKRHPADAVREAWDAGQRIFGESRVQELLEKVPLLPSAVSWHFIGHLQSNKVRKVLPLATLIHGVDSVALARDIDRIAHDTGTWPRVLLEVNVSGEGSKQGFKQEVLETELDALLGLERLQVEGLMTIAPLADDPEKSRPHFAALRELRDSLAARAGVPLKELSMGMSADFEAAVSEGSTMVRVGTAIFGAREP